MRIIRVPNDSHCENVQIDITKDKIVEELKKRAKSPHDMITDGVLAYGVNLGRFVYEEEGYTVYVISDFPHIGPSDVFMVYQISKADYEKLLSLSCKGNVPQPSVSSAVTNECRKEFLCGESAYCERYYCALENVDLSLAEKTVTSEKEAEVMKHCPNCGKKNSGDKF